MIKARSSRVVPAAPCEVYALLIDPARRLKLSPAGAEVFFEAERPDGLRSAHLRAHSPRGGTVKTRSTDVEREPSFHRLDVRIEKRWLIGQRGWLAFVAEMMNATFNKETIGETEIGPVTIPSIGLEGGF